MFARWVLRQRYRKVIREVLTRAIARGIIWIARPALRATPVLLRPSEQHRFAIADLETNSGSCLIQHSRASELSPYRLKNREIAVFSNLVRCHPDKFDSLVESCPLDQPCPIPGEDRRAPGRPARGNWRNSIPIKTNRTPSPPILPHLPAS